VVSDLRLGQVGLGWFGGIHLQTWSGIEGVHIVGACDRDPDRLTISGSQSPQDEFHVTSGNAEPVRLPPTAITTDDLDELLALGLDVLDVVVSEDAHSECVRRGLEAGVDVIVEKPLALTHSEAQSLCGLARETGRNLYVGHIMRFDPRAMTAAAVIAGHDLRHLSMHRNFQRSAHDVYGRTHPIHTAAIHDLDLALWYVGRPPRAVSSFASWFLERETPDVVDIVLHWEHGLRAVIQNSWHLAAGCPYGFEFECKVQTSDETVVVRNQLDVEVWDATTARSPELFFWPYLDQARRGALRSELEHFATCARNQLPSDRVPLEQVLWLMEVAEAAIEAQNAADGRSVPL
jgi:predicted dehydrogenase